MPLTDISYHTSDDNGSEEAWIAKLERNEFDNLEKSRDSPSDEENRRRKKMVDKQQFSQRPVTFLHILGSFLICFSLRKNLKVIGKHANGKGTNSENSNHMGDIKVIHGLRTLTMIWIIFGHTIGLVSPEMMSKYDTSNMKLS